MVKPLSQMPFDLAKRIDKIDRALDREFQRETLTLAAAAAIDAQEDQMRQDAGGDLTLSRVRSGKGARIGARRGRMTADTVDIKAVGPVPLIANKLDPHRIPRATGRRRRKRLAIPGVGVFSAVNHPGVQRGKDTWDKGQIKAAPRVTAIVRKRADLTVIAAFKADI